MGGKGSSSSLRFYYLNLPISGRVRRVSNVYRIDRWRANPARPAPSLRPPFSRSHRTGNTSVSGHEICRTRDGPLATAGCLGGVVA